MSDLAASWAQFKQSSEARQAPVPLGDWHSRRLDNAAANGDLEADANPDTSFSSGAWMPDYTQH